MINHTTEFLAQYRKAYGRSAVFGITLPDYSRCAGLVRPGDRTGIFTEHQCYRNNGHGPHGAWCRQHNPEVIAAKEKTARAAREAKWELEKQRAALAAEKLTIITMIAEGHDAPQSLCIDYLNRVASIKERAARRTNSTCSVRL